MVLPWTAEEDEETSSTVHARGSGGPDRWTPTDESVPLFEESQNKDSDLDSSQLTTELPASVLPIGVCVLLAMFVS